MSNPGEMAGLVPVIETTRLLLRAHRASDFDDCARMWGDPAIVRHIGGKPSTPDESWSRILRYAGLWSLLGFGYWALEEKASRRFVGEAGFADFKRDLEPSIGGMPEIGWALASWVQGKGFATEAVGAVVAWGDVHFGSIPTVCLIHPDNAASIRVAEKSGYRELMRTAYKGSPTILFRR